MAYLVAVWTFCLFLARVANATKYGTIGYGINMFHPFCCYACHDSLAMVYLNCTTFSESSGAHDGMSMKLLKRMDMDMAGSTSDDCYATDEPYLQSFAYCIQSHCDIEGLSYEKQNACFREMAANGLPVPSLEDSLPTVPPTEELAEHAMWLNKTMQVNEAYWKADRGTIDEFEHSEVYHVRFSIIVMSLSVGIPLLAGLWLWLTALLPTNLRQDGLVIWLQASFLLPALLRKRHAQPLPFRLGYLPNRSMAGLLTLYVILNIVFCAVPYRSVQPNTWFSNRNQEMAAYIGNRTGVLSFANMALAILFSTRNNPLMYLSGWSQTTFLAFHRWAARVAILQAVVHSIVYTADYCYYKDGGNAYYAEAAKPYFWWGIIATTAMGLMAGLSALPLRMYAYELFLGLHIVLAILSLVGSWYHVDLRFSKNWGYEVWLYIAFAFWAWDRLVRLFKVAYYNFPSGTSAQVELLPGTNVVMLTMFPGRHWKAHPGQHTFVYFPTLKRVWENHPFTILDWGMTSPLSQARLASNSSSGDQTPNKEGSVKQDLEPSTTARHRHCQPSPDDGTEARFYVRCLFRAQKGATGELRHALLKAQSPTTIPSLVEGPYGGLELPTRALLRHADRIICVAGGIGITYAASFAKQFAHERANLRASSPKDAAGTLFPRCKQFTLAWTVRELELFQYVRHNLLPDLSEGGLDDESLRYRFWITGTRTGEGSADTTSTAFETQPQSQPEPVILPDKTIQVTAETQTEKLITTVSGHRMDVAQVIAAESNASSSTLDTRVAVLVCGPGGLADEVRFQVARVARKGVLVDLIEETFSW
ncbi:ferric-chelate reductase [Cladophialophora carrionii]|uniref:Ferric-chelate reductase n=1 Tax=Cladophialophora carrionii TaxID=86049 RepID=A0A1C1D130_9EURO|nr:ferric-chelate reductase [Cladophialophora carrionii]